MNYYDFYYPLMRKDESISKNCWSKVWLTSAPQNEKNNFANELLKLPKQKENYFKWIAFDEMNDINNIQEEKENMNKCEFELGDILVAKDEVDEVLDGTAILLCCGYNKDDFTVVQNDKGVCVAAMKKHIECDGDMYEENDIEEFQFNFNKYFKVEKVSYNVRDGIFILNVDYDTNGNVEIDESL